MSNTKHVHKWQFAELSPIIYETRKIYVGTFILSIPNGKILKEETIVFVCECGAKKEVEHTEEVNPTNYKTQQEV